MYLFSCLMLNRQSSSTSNEHILLSVLNLMNSIFNFFNTFHMLITRLLNSLKTVYATHDCSASVIRFIACIKQTKQYIILFYEYLAKCFLLNKKKSYVRIVKLMIENTHDKTNPFVLFFKIVKNCYYCFLRNHF